MWHWVARGNIQQISYIPQMEQHSPFGLMLLWAHAAPSGECNCYDRLVYAKRFANSHRSFMELHLDHTHEDSTWITDAHETII